MRPLRLLNSFFLFLTAFLIMLLCFFHYHYPEQVKRNEWKYHSKNQEFLQVLRKATMPDRTIILTMVDESYARPGSMLDILLQSFKFGQETQRYLNHLVIITMDPKAFEYCRSLHPHCIHPSTFEPYFENKRESTIFPDHNVLSWRRNIVLTEVIELAYNIIFTDADVLWFRSPLQNFDPGNEISISCNFSSDGEKAGALHDGGIFYLKANARALEFFKYWKLTMILYPNLNVEESMCETIMENKDIVDELGFRVHHVDINHFGGFCQLNKDMLKKAYTIHANCCNDLRSKVHDLKLVLDDWIHFIKHVSKDNGLRWPQKCTR